MFYIFLPRKVGARREHLVEAGLAELLRPDDDQPGSVDLVGPGPGNLPGQVWSWHAAYYKPETQIWHQARGKDYWYGFDKGCSFAKALSRTRQFRGRGLFMQEWLLPDVEHVPHFVDVDERGELCLSPDLLYRHFAEEAGLLLGDFARNQDEPDGWGWERLAKFVISGLGLNYRINAELIAHLRLFDKDDLWPIAFKMVSAESLRAVIEGGKKKAADTLPGSAPSGG